MARYIIVGGVAGGATTAARLRRIDESAEIIIYERGEYISYANCGLPYYLGGAIRDRNRLFVESPNSFKEKLNIDVRTLCEVISIDKKKKTITIRDVRDDNETTEKYDKLVLSPGAEPVKPPIEGINSPKIFTIRNVRDTDAIKSFLDTQNPKRVIVVGAGFIGLEMAENLHKRGVFVTIVEMADQVMTPLDYEMAAEVHQHLKVKGVEFYLKDGVKSFKDTGYGISIELQSGRIPDADFVILSIGIKPDSFLAEQAGLDIGETRGIKVDKYLNTKDPDIYAVGDAIEFPSPITGKPTITYLAGPANKQGRICADNIVFGNNSEYKGAVGTAVAKVFDITVASTGVSEKVLHREGIEYKSCITHSSSHAGYYPGAAAMSLKILFSPKSGRLFGAQIVGYDGVDKRIDLMASVISRKGTIYDLTEIEHAYAPPYSSAKDPINIIGFVAENILKERTRHLQWNELRAMDQNKIQIIDVRLPEETALGTIEGSDNIPLQQIRERLNEVRKDRTIVIYCSIGLRGYFAERILRQNGFGDVYNLSGGYKTWEYAIQKQSNEDIFAKDYIGKNNMIYQADVEGKHKEREGITERIDIRIVDVDARGLQCPGPILELKNSIDGIAQEDRLRIKASDPGFVHDVKAWCEITGNILIDLKQEGECITAVIEKAAPKPESVASVRNTMTDTSIILFSDDFDRALASLVVANGATSVGKKTTLFFTFWGLNLIKKKNPPKVKKDLMGRMFSLMMASNSKKLKLSKMNMGNMGVKMIRKRMKDLNINSLEEMLQSAMGNGVRMVACTMSMDVMGVKKEELIDGVEVGGVATYLQASDTSTNTLFI